MSGRYNKGVVDYELLPMARAGSLTTDLARIAVERRAARRTIIARLERAGTRAVMAALDLWPRDQRDRP